MWRPAARTTGTNDVPIGNKRRFGLPEEAPPPSNQPSHAPRPPASDIQFFNGRQERDRSERDDYGRRDDYDRRRDDYRRDDRGGYGGDRDRGGRYDEPERGRERDGAGEDGPRKRRSRWGDAKVDVPGLPVAITGKVSQTELDNYAIHVRLEEINRKLRTGDVVPPEGQRSPSPPPSYDAYGRRTNTREIRYKKKLEDEKARLVDRAMKSDPNFKPPAEMQNRNRNGGKPTDKVYIPVKEFPEINFFGLLVGPRGNSLKRMERESGAKISIRGKGSVKEGKGRPGEFEEEEKDELHCLIHADTEEKVKGCVALINRVIETAASTPEGQNDHKRNQLRELASLNGTLRDDENQLCQNCGEKGHRRWECPQQRVYSANVICRLCGGAGHMARDCRGRGDPNLTQNKQTAFDSEYTALMAELGEGGSGGGASSGRPAGAIAGAPPAQDRVPPWRVPENWISHGPGGPRGPPGGGGGYGGYHGGPPQHGYQQQQQGYGQGGGQGGYGGYNGGYGGGGGQDNGYGQGGQAGAQAGAADPYAAYYASMGQQATPAA
ncbi:branchpoint-bridging protein [Kwoniella dendrophila CBS 6074]|uniref:Branchpoint-bridging protein n=1 Tax=Kwoniella dendrophila CBS 6074 TaxID=1295534 RepID=A0AAX4JUZ8_9TREE